MTNRIATPITTAGKHSKRWSLLLAGSAAVALALGLGIGTWQMHSRSGRPAAVQTTVLRPTALGSGAASAATSDQEAYQQFGSLAFANQVQVAAIARGAAVAAPYLYLVGSAEQANQVQQGVNWAAAAGLTVDATVRQVSGDTEADAAMRAVADENTLRASLGLAEIAVVDLRSSGLSTPVEVAPRPQETTPQVCASSGCLTP